MKKDNHRKVFDLAIQVQYDILHSSVVKNIDISINIDTEISERYQY